MCLACRDKELEKDAALRAQSNNMLEYGQVCMATSNLYARCCKKSSISHPPDEANPMHQLDIVGHFVRCARLRPMQRMRTVPATHRLLECLALVIGLMPSVVCSDLGEIIKEYKQRMVTMGRTQMDKSFTMTRPMTSKGRDGEQ